MRRRRTGVHMLSDLGPTSLRGGSNPVADLTGDELLQRLPSDCFICHRALVSDLTDSNEDVFPQWLQKHFQIADEMINLLDGSGKKYREVLVPCCRQCNNEDMSNVETRVSAGVKGGAARLAALDRSDLFLWSAKIMYGLLHLETSPRDPTDKTLLSPRVTPAVLDHLRVTMMLLAGFRKRVIVDAPAFPASILLFPLKSGGPPKLTFNYRDSFEWPPALALRLGAVGMIVSFEDFGFIEHWYRQSLEPIVAGHVLHPLQFAEVAARAFYEAGLGAFDVRYTAIEGANDLFLTLMPIPMHGLPPDQLRLARMISEFSGVALDEIWHDASKRVKCTLVNKDDAFLDLPFTEGLAYPL